MTKYAFISSMGGAPWGGSEELWSQTALRLKESGAEISASVSDWPQLSPKILNLRSSGISLNLRKQTFWHRNWRKVQREFNLLSGHYRWLQRQAPDLVVISQGAVTDGLEWLDFCRRVGLPYVVIVQANAEQWWPDDSLAAQLRLAYQGARRIFCVSQRNLHLLEDQIGTNLDNAEVVWNPINLQTNPMLEWPDDTKLRFACVARLEPDAKGQDLLFHALASETWRQRSFELNLYGTGKSEQTLNRLKERLALHNVNFKSPVADITEIWKINHILILPSRYEGLPLTLVEAMKCGRAAVITDVAGNCEVGVDGETAFVAPAPTVAFLTEALERAWSNRSNWQQMGENARKRVEELMPNDPIQVFSEKLVALLK